VDRQAAYMDRIVWFRWWLVLLGPVGILMGAQWDRPLITVPGAVLVLAVGLWSALYMRRLYGAAERWVADPPGPAREMPPLRRCQRWASGWGFVWTLLGFLLVTVGLAAVAILVR
jgi:hypothetical protein